MFYQLLHEEGNSSTMFYPLTPAGLEVAEAEPSGTVGTMVVGTMPY